MGVYLQDKTPLRKWADRSYGCGDTMYTFDSAGRVEVADADHIRHFVEQHDLQPVSGDGRDFVVIGLRQQTQDHELHAIFSDIHQYTYILTYKGAVVMQRKPDQKERKK